MLQVDNFLCQWRPKVSCYKETPSNTEDTIVNIPYETTEWNKDYHNDSLTSTSCHYRHALKELAKMTGSRELEIELLSMYRTE
jgi:hypothetical protein|nr:MAG TPA: hypothetical protein [Caudoviricetes sp.]